MSMPTSEWSKPQNSTLRPCRSERRCQQEGVLVAHHFPQPGEVVCGRVGEDGFSSILFVVKPPRSLHGKPQSGPVSAERSCPSHGDVRDQRVRDLRLQAIQYVLTVCLFNIRLHPARLEPCSGRQARRSRRPRPPPVSAATPASSPRCHRRRSGRSKAHPARSPSTAAHCSGHLGPATGGRNPPSRPEDVSIEIRCVEPELPHLRNEFLGKAPSRYPM